jgi:hypothetical protein
MCAIRVEVDEFSAIQACDFAADPHTSNQGVINAEVPSVRDRSLSHIQGLVPKTVVDRDRLTDYYYAGNRSY